MAAFTKHSVVTRDRGVASWLQQAQAGDTIVYFLGSVAGAYPHHAPRGPVLEARHAYNAGLVDLVQRRRKEGSGYEYVAIRRKHRARIEPYQRFRGSHIGERDTKYDRDFA